MNQLVGSVALACTLIASGLATSSFAQSKDDALAPSSAPGDAAAKTSRNVLTSHFDELYSLPMLPLWLCSVVMLALIFERAGALRARRVLDPALAQRVIELAGQLRLEEAYDAAKKSPTVVGQAWAQGLHEFLLGGVTLSDALTGASVLALKPLKRNLQGISTIAVIAPLLGLLGTVVGMVLVFDEISVSQDPDKQRMAEGIMVALFTTVLGITIAVPGIVVGRYFQSRIVAYAEAVEADIDRIRLRFTHARSQLDADESSYPENVH